MANENTLPSTSFQLVPPKTMIDMDVKEYSHFIYLPL